MVATKGPRGAGLVVDTHAHWFPEEWVRLVEKEGACCGATITRSGDNLKFTGGGLTSVFSREFVDIDRRLAAMDRQGVDVHALSLTTPMVYFAPPDYALALSQAYNDAAAAAHQKYPTRFIGMAMLPMHAPALALKEIERAAKLPGMRGLYMGTHVHDKELDDPSFFEVYARCEELGWPIYLHPMDPIGMPRMKKYYLINLCGNPYDSGIAAAHLIFGGVMDRFPKLHVMLPHAGGTFPALVGRWDHGTKVRPELKHMRQPPSAYLRRFSYDTIGHNDEIMTNLIRMVGADRVVLGSDYCFDMGHEEPVQIVERWTHVAASERDLILGGNATRMLRL
jgi:aminocarboxymuconate-semialdehyde decarboxylase